MAIGDFTGKVNIKIYFGTKFDDLNVPHHNDLLRNSATKVMEVDASFVWQTTWLSIIQINISNYQDIVGAQYVEINETPDGAAFHGVHWYSVVGYQNMSNRCVQIGIKYDALLSIGIAHIDSIDGIMRRWTVDDDTHFNYINSSEPINQMDDFDFDYYRYNPIIEGNPRRIVGFPYDMSVQPDIISWINANGQDTNVYYPKLTSGKIENTTVFLTELTGNNSARINDSMFYYRWYNNYNTHIPYKNYSDAMGLGYDLVCNAYSLPLSDSIEIFGGDGSVDYVISTIWGHKVTFNANMDLYKSGYNNNKAGEIGTSFSLYNEITGESANVSNKEIKNLDVEVFANPYSNGCFYARFASYFNDNDGYSGWVKSVGWQPLSMSSEKGINTTSNALSNMMEMNNAMLSNSNAALSQNTNLANTFRNASTSGTNAIISAGTSAVMSPAGALIGGTHLGNSISSQITNIDNAIASYNTTMDILDSQRTERKNALTTQGTLGQIIPPSFKLANNYFFEKIGYNFVVRETSISRNDRVRADNFFTAWGYNVDNTILSDISQLRCRERFTFIMADYVNIYSVSGSTDLTRLRDNMTLMDIRSRFSAGLRIWLEEPDFDWNKPNDIV